MRQLDRRRRTRSGFALLFWASILLVVSGNPCLAGPVKIFGHATTTLRPESDALSLNDSNKGETRYDLLDLDLFLQASPSDRLNVQTWLVVNEVFDSSVAIGSLYFMYEVVDEGALFFEAGKIPTAFGTYIERFSSEKGPLVGIPLMYYFHGGLVRDRVPRSVDDLLAVRGQGQLSSVTYPGQETTRGRGMTILYAACYDIGVAIIGARGPWEYRASVTHGTQGAPVYQRDGNDSKTVTARVGWSPGPAIRFGVSASSGAYLNESLEGDLPPEASIGEYRQDLVGADLEASRGYWTIYGEWALSRAGTPFIEDDLDMTSYFVEVHRRLFAGTTVGVRWEELVFNEVSGATGPRRWDISRKRLELAGEYAWTRALSSRLSWQMNHAGVSGFDPDENFGALQFLVRF